MSFKINISFTLSLNLGWVVADATPFLSQQSAKDENNIPPSPAASFRASSTGLEPDNKDQVPHNPVKAVRPHLHKLRHHLHGKDTPSTRSSWNMLDHPIVETQVAKAKDRESLKVLLRSTSKSRQSTHDGSQHNTPVSPTRHSGSSSGQLNEVTFPNTVPVQPSVSSNSPAGASDSSSDLVSSLQRLRVGGLASYFEKLNRSASQHSSASRVSAVRASTPAVKDVERSVEELAQVSIEDEDWEDLTVANASD